MAPRPNVRSAISHIFERMQRETALRRLKTASLVQDQLLEVMSEVAAVKRQAVRELRATGHSFASIGRELGITTSRVKQIEQGGAKNNHHDDEPGDPVPEPVS